MSISKKDAATNLIRVTNELYKSVNNANYKKTGMYSGKNKILMYIADRGENYPNQKEIAKTFEITPSAVAVTLKQLEKDGLVKRTVLEIDNRVNRVALTDKAKKLAAESKETTFEVCEKAFDNFTDNELETLSMLLDKLGKNLQLFLGWYHFEKMASLCKTL